MSSFISPLSFHSCDCIELGIDPKPHHSERLVENSELTPYSDADLPSSECDLKHAYRECGSMPYQFVLAFEYKGPKDAKIIFSPIVFSKSKACLFISVVKENQEGDDSPKQVKAKFDLSDPKYAPFLERFETPAFKIRFVDSNLHFEDLLLAKPLSELST